MRTLFIFVIFSFIGMHESNSQFLKKLQKRAEAALEDKVDEALGDNGEKDDTPSQTPGNQVGKEQNPSINEIPDSGEHHKVTAYKGLVLGAPNSGLLDIELNEYKSLPLFKGNSVTDSEVAYKKLLEMKYLLPLYNKMDRIYLGTDKSSVIPQAHLRGLAGYSLKEEGMLEFLANDQGNIGAMAYKKAPYKYKPQKWGGDFANTFENQKAFSGFNEKHLDDLMEWSKTFWPQNHQNAFVQKASLGFYDFKKGGIWISFKPEYVGMDKVKNFIKYVPKYDYENSVSEKIAPNNGYDPFVLLRIDMDTAERFFDSSGSQTIIYLLYTVKLAKNQNQPSEITDVESPVEFVYNLESSAVEVFSDEDLKNKIGELDYRKLEFR